MKRLLSKAEMKTVVGNDIRKYRDEKCLTQSYMASELGIGQSAYQKIEAGESKVSIERLTQIAQILGKSVHNFLGKAEDKKEEEPIPFLHIPKKEYELLQKIILQQEKRIEELEEKVKRKNDELEELKLQLILK